MATLHFEGKTYTVNDQGWFRPRDAYRLVKTHAPEHLEYFRRGGFPIRAIYPAVRLCNWVIRMRNTTAS